MSEDFKKYWEELIDSEYIFYRFYGPLELDKMEFLLHVATKKLRRLLDPKVLNSHIRKYQIWTLTAIIRALQREIRLDRERYRNPSLNYKFRPDVFLKYQAIDSRAFRISLDVINWVVQQLDNKRTTNKHDI